MIKTLTIQINANQETTKINSKTAEVYELQQFNEMFNTLFTLYKGAKDNYKYEDYDNGRESLVLLVHQLKQDNQDIFSKKADYNILNEKAIEVYESFYAKNHNVVSVHFRLLYRLFKLIQIANISDSNRTIISKTVRCQLTEEELFLLRYNAMSKCGSKMQVYINQYNLLKHFPLLNALEYISLTKKMDTTDINYINWELQQLNKSIRKLFLEVSTEEKRINAKLSEDNKYSLKIKISSDNKSFYIELVKDNNIKPSKENNISIVSALDKLNNEELMDLLQYYVKELFVYSNFQVYNKLEELAIEPEISNQTKSKKNLISINIKNKNGYPLICCKKQLDDPQ